MADEHGTSTIRVMPRQLTSRVMIALSAALLVGCGSTAQVTGTRQVSAAATGTDGLAVSPTDGGVAPTAPATGVPVGGGPTGGAGAGASGGPVGPVEAGVGPPAALGQVLSPTVFKVGLQYSSNAQATLGAIGASSSSNAPDFKVSVQAVIDYVNRHGGVAGRRMVPVYNDVDATATPQQESEQACTQWSQDDHVSIALPASAVEDNNALRTCMGKAGIPVIYSNVFSTTLASSFAGSPLWAESIGASVESYARTYVAGLAAQRFFSGAKVGVVYYDGAAFKTALQSALLPALKAAGVADPATYGASISGASDLGAGSSQMSAAVLSFRSKGVDRVLFFEPWAGYFAFLNAAQAQGYRPRYGLTSQEAPEVALSLGLVSADQLADSRLVSWWPLADVRDYAKYVGPRYRVCLSIFKQAGVGVASDRTGLGTELAMCESLLITQDVYSRAPATLTGGVFTRGLEALGSRVAYATRPLGSFGPGKHYGASVYYAGHFDAACGCFALDPAPHAMKP